MTIDKEAPYPLDMSEQSTLPLTGTQRILHAFARAQAEHRAALVAFMTAGYPDLATSARIAQSIVDAGADVVEVGVPFSDPIADGPIIAQSMHEALLAGCTPHAAFEALAEVMRTSSVPFVSMSSVSIDERLGVDAFVDLACDAGITGFIAPDADTDALDSFARAAIRRGACLTMLIAPTTSQGRMEELLARTSGFIYLLARAGITGDSSGALDVGDRVTQLRQHTKKPIAVGFGIARADQVRTVGASADGVIVGTAIVRVVRDAVAAGQDPALAAFTLVRELRAACARA